MQNLQVKERQIKGKKVKTLRQAGFLPAVIYGEGIPSQSISVPYKDFEKAYREAGESTLLKIEVDGESHNVLIHGIAYDPLKGNPIHADFYAVRMDRLIRTKVPLEFIGESPAVKKEGGVLVKVMQEIEVEALPQNLPHEIRADISVLDSIELKLFVKDLKLPQGVRIMTGAEEVVVLVEAPRSEEEFAAVDAGVEGAHAEVKTEREVKV
jgi:large subunit ribosomal protein L25